MFESLLSNMVQHQPQDPLQVRVAPRGAGRSEHAAPRGAAHAHAARACCLIQHMKPWLMRACLPPPPQYIIDTVEFNAEYAKQVRARCVCTRMHAPACP